MYRYRDNAGSTHQSLNRTKHVVKLGKLKYVRGYVYLGRYGAHHAGVLVRGENGTARFGGFSWGYSGEGPRGLVQFLLSLGYKLDEVQKVVYMTPWGAFNKAEEAWKLAA